MPCYREGGCGPFEMFSCNECPASKPNYRSNQKPEVEKSLKEINISIYDKNNKIKSLYQILSEVSDKWNELLKGEQYE